MGVEVEGPCEELGRIKYDPGILSEKIVVYKRV